MGGVAGVKKKRLACPWPTKVAWPTPKAAEAQARWLRRAKGVLVVPYQCPAGGHWHVGHKRKVAAPRRRRR